MARWMTRIGLKAWPGKLLIFSCLGTATSACCGQVDTTSEPGPSLQCAIDLKNPGEMKDIVSNALVLGLHHSQFDVDALLTGAEERYATG